MLSDLILRAEATFVRRFLRGGWANRSGAKANLTQRGDPWILANSLYRAAFGRVADREELAKRTYQLQSGVSREPWQRSL
jgi:hypothetical protein